MKRDKLVDCLKGYACFLVVFGHVIMGIRNAGIVCPAYSEKLEMFIWSFHVALFFFLSGYVYNITGEWRRKKRMTPAAVRPRAQIPTKIMGNFFPD